MSLHLKTLLEDGWLLNTSLDVAEYAHNMGRISEEQFQAYMFVWTWGAPRWGGVAAIKQDAYFHRFGEAALMRRVARTKRWIEAAKKLDAQK